MKSKLPITCLDCRRTPCPHIRLPTGLGKNQQLALRLVSETPGLSRAELGRLIWPERNDYYSLRWAVKLIKGLVRRGLLEYGVIHEGGRAGVAGLYVVGQTLKEKPGYLGVNGWVSERKTTGYDEKSRIGGTSNSP